MSKLSHSNEDTMRQIETARIYEELSEHEAFDIFIEEGLDPLDDIKPVLGASIANDYAQHIYFTLK